MLRVLLAFNTMALLGLAGGTFLAYADGKFAALGGFVELDRAGAIQPQALTGSDSSYRFGNADSLEYRERVPMFLVAAALQDLMLMGCLGVSVGLVNAVSIVAILWLGRSRKARSNGDTALPS
jgi:hypothetical protein